ncbi:phage tail protein [Pandoraea nosoerga]|uniref:phage tail protein n=1 Tax=Pandoraea nosoerga TaxID=2508296 RepID=UPI00197DB528|nr:phage tail protein [Pandoraea nosoerga]MBN4667202.1 phage tail protein [Pandoraea nosoerga]MBN4677189.1 phage tail protein [Pandoraea nosoerga]MBN4681989.1 phage tail protein [Pandoraea nosoerga]MBN4746307.1 phage tail protein [Pandoraea nosoerga]
MEKKTVYQTDEHGFFLYSATAHELYLSPGNFNVPYGAVEVQPPTVESGKVPMWDGATWSVVEDHRDKTLYVAESGREYQLGTAVEIDGESVTYLGGGPIPPWLTLDAPPPVTSDTI